MIEHTALLFSMLFFGGDVYNMGSSNYRTREAASCRAERMAPLNWLALRHGCKSKDLEVRRRCRVAIRSTDATLHGLAVHLEAAHLIYGGKQWQLSNERALRVESGSRELHQALYAIAVQQGLFSKSESINAYYMVEFTHLMRRRARGIGGAFYEGN